jgi:hypothetical protein
MRPDSYDYPAGRANRYIAAAQVHATLAPVAATTPGHQLETDVAGSQPAAPPARVVRYRTMSVQPGRGQFIARLWLCLMWSCGLVVGVRRGGWWCGR